VALLLEGDAAVRRAIERAGRRVTSALTVAETRRAVLRARFAGRIDAAQERVALASLGALEPHLDLIAISDVVLARSGRPFPDEPVRTLDAIHLASLDLVGDAPQLVTVLTRDARVARNARALGYAVA
jgi:predicted nucleic acid-binding protein